MKSRNDNKIVIIISIISIIGTIIFGLIYSKNSHKETTYKDFNEYFHYYVLLKIQFL